MCLGGVLSRSAVRQVLISLLMASTLVLPSAARSQEPSLGPALAGKKVRLLAPAVVSGRIEGVVLLMDRESLLVSQASGARLKVPRQAVTQLEVSTGRHRHTLKGMWIGASALALLAVPVHARGGAATDIALGAVAGGLWGAGIGTLVEGERWNSVPLNQVIPGPREGPTSSLSLTVRF
jgi:hypothetical protein